LRQAKQAAAIRKRSVGEKPALRTDSVGRISIDFPFFYGILIILIKTLQKKSPLISNLLKKVY